MTDTERQELYTLMQQWGCNDDILYQKVREWVEARIAALQLERDALRIASSSGVVSIDKIGTPREPAIVDGCEGYPCVCCDKKPTTKHLRLRWTYYPLCNDCWETLSQALTPVSGEPARKPLEAQNG
jgi:hypothetical protein